MKDWIDYYDSDHTIYVNRRHRDVHFAELGRAIAALIPRRDAVVLDYACGEALGASAIAGACAHLILAEPAAGVRERLRERFAAETRIRVCSLDDLAAEPAGRVDLIVMNSVAQYMTDAQLEAAFATARRLLKPDGSLIVGDIISPDTGPLTDAAALLGFAAGNGFLAAALAGLVRTALSDYRKLRSQIGLRRYSDAQIIARLKAAGLEAVRCPRNLGHNPWRTTFKATPVP
jgi:ubiquinone/menaquinone biosynthesis C-methylase UbiE